MLSFKAMAIHIINNRKFHGENLETTLSELMDDCIGQWHASSNSEVTCLAYLGLSWDEFSQYVSHPDSFFRDLIASHTSNSQVG